MPLPYFPFYARDWLSSGRIVGGMDLEHEGAYIRLLARMWDQAPSVGGCWLPDDNQWLARACGVKPARWARIRAVLVEGPYAVFAKQDGRLVNARLSVEWEKAQKFSENQSQRASGSVRKPRDTRAAQSATNGRLAQAAAEPRHSRGTAGAQPEASHTDADPDPDVPSPPGPVPPVPDAPVDAKASTSASSSSAASQPTTLPTPAAVKDAWNAAMDGTAIPAIRALTDTRLAHLRQRQSGHPERGLEWWAAYFARIRGSGFCCGQGPGRDGATPWIADFDWATRSETVVSRVLEGRYDDRRAPQQARASPAVMEFARMVDEAAAGGGGG